MSIAQISEAKSKALLHLLGLEGQLNESASLEKDKEVRRVYKAASAALWRVRQGYDPDRGIKGGGEV